MNLNGLYQILKSEQRGDDSFFRYNIRINPDHIIFKGHFPNFPVLPGACQLAITTELLERQLGVCLILFQASTIKFLKMIDPRFLNELEVNILLIEQIENTVQIRSDIQSNSKCCMKFKGIYKKIEYV